MTTMRDQIIQILSTAADNIVRTIHAQLGVQDAPVARNRPAKKSRKRSSPDEVKKRIESIVTVLKKGPKGAQELRKHFLQQGWAKNHYDGAIALASSTKSVKKKGDRRHTVYSA